MLDNSMSTTQHPMAISDRIDTYIVNCMSLFTPLECCLCTVVLRSYIHPLARSPLAAAINWVAAHSAKVKRLAKPESARKKDNIESDDAIKDIGHVFDYSRLATRADMNNILKQLDDLKEEVDKHLKDNQRI